MKFKLLSALLVSSALTMSAQGYKDGIEYYKAGQYENAITLLQRNKDNAGADKALAQYYLGQSYLALDELDKAKAAFEAGVAADAENPFNYVGLGAIQMKNNNVTLARDNFKRPGIWLKRTPRCSSTSPAPTLTPTPLYMPRTSTN